MGKKGGSGRERERGCGVGWMEGGRILETQREREGVELDV